MISLKKPALALIAVTLAGCSTGGAGATGTSATANAQDQAVKFAQCMRQHGVDVPDPQPGQGGIQIKASAGSVDQAKLQQAMNACRKYSPKLAGNPNNPAQRDRMLKLAQCLRQHGINIPDPQPGQGLRIRVNKADAAKMQQAQQACRKEVPPLTASPSAGG